MSIPTDPKQQRADITAPPQPDAQSFRLFSQYRLFLITALAAVFYLSPAQSILGQRDALLFEVSLLGYLVTALGFIYLQNISWSSTQTRLYLQHYLDIAFICLMMYASGGVQSGFGTLLIITIALLSQLNSARYALYFASLACVLILLEELFAKLLIDPAAASFDRTALLGSILIAVAWLFTVPVRKLASRTMTPATKERAGLNIEQIAKLNEEIIRELDSGVMVIDSNNQIQLINDMARTLIGCEFNPLPAHVGRICSPLLESLNNVRHGSANAVPFDIDATGITVLPQFIPLSSGAMLVKLDDHAIIKKQFQQLKLASLGRLSASIAHEIRNPLGAISHAIQLLQESNTMDEADAELLFIAYKHTNRIDRIVDDILQLSMRKQVSYLPVDLNDQLTRFCERFISENGLPEGQITLNSEPNLIASFDPEHLDQVLWNLCANARRHNHGNTVNITISSWIAQQGEIVVDIVDDGKGIADIHREQLFEPFYSTHHDGAGLGLYIIRELCELNKASIDCIDRDAGAHFRLTLSSAQQMAA